MVEEDIINAVVEHVAGEDVLPLVEVLKGKKNVSEFTLAEELKEEINTIRNKLYRLYDSNLVRFIRKKDKVKGWYIYYWTFVPSRIPRLSKELKKKHLDKLKERLVKEQQGDFFECKNKCMRLNFEKAIDHEFKCPECGELMNQEDNTKRVDSLRKEILSLEKEILAEPDLIEEHFEEVDEELHAEEPEEMKKERKVVVKPKVKAVQKKRETKVKKISRR